MTVELSKQNVDAVRSLINHPGWTSVFVPALEKKREQLLGLLVNGSQKRKEDHSDDFLRASIQMLDSLLSYGPAFIDEWDATVERQMLAETLEEDHVERAMVGRVGPLPTNG